MGNTLSKIKKIIIFTIITAFIVSVIICIAIFLTVQKYESLIYPNVIVQEMDLGGMSKEDAYDFLKTNYEQRLLSKKIILKTPDKDYPISYSQLNATVNLKETIDKAFSIGKSEHVLTKYKLIKSKSPTYLSLKLDYDIAPLKKLIGEISQDIFVEKKEATLSKDRHKGFVITPDTIGKYITESEVLELTTNSIDNTISVNENLVSVPIHEIFPDITMEYLKQMNTLISSYTTTFYGSSPERIHNIQLATNALNNTIVDPNSDFSFNKVVGSRTKENGYKEGKIILNNKYIPGIGGGICQVSSTLYNAILQCNIPYTERNHHTLPSSYVPVGLDATISGDYKDFKFNNTLPYPIYIEGYCENKTVTFNIYSNKPLSKIKYKLKSNVTKVIPNGIKHINDPLLPKGHEEVETNGTKGYKVEVYLIGYENNKEVSNKLLYKDYYEPVDKRIRIGTARTH